MLHKIANVMNRPNGKLENPISKNWSKAKHFENPFLLYLDDIMNTTSENLLSHCATQYTTPVHYLHEPPSVSNKHLLGQN